MATCLASGGVGEFTCKGGGGARNALAKWARTMPPVSPPPPQEGKGGEAKEISRAAMASAVSNGVGALVQAPEHISSGGVGNSGGSCATKRGIGGGSVSQQQQQQQQQQQYWGGGGAGLTARGVAPGFILAGLGNGVLGNAAANSMGQPGGGGGGGFGGFGNGSGNSGSSSHSGASRISMLRAARQNSNSNGCGSKDLLKPNGGATHGPSPDRKGGDAKGTSSSSSSPWSFSAASSTSAGSSLAFLESALKEYAGRILTKEEVRSRVQSLGLLSLSLLPCPLSSIVHPMNE